MLRTTLLALALAGAVLPARADEAQDYQRMMAARREAKAPQPIDMSRPVTMTGTELQAYVTAAVAAAEARQAAERIAPIDAKIRAALTPPAEPQAETPKPAPEPVPAQ